MAPPGTACPSSSLVNPRSPNTQIRDHRRWHPLWEVLWVLRYNLIHGRLGLHLGGFLCVLEQIEGPLARVGDRADPQSFTRLELKMPASISITR